METNATSLMTDWRRMLQWLTRDWRLCLKSVFQVPSFMFQVVEVAPRNLKLETLNQPIVASSVTLAFMELEIRQLCSAFSMSSLALAASPPGFKVIEGRMVIAVN